jgi:hypothetical protein
MLEQSIEQPVETVVEIEDDEPVYYKPRSLNLVATISGVLSWITLAVFVIDMVVQAMNVQSQLASQNLVLANLIGQPAFQSYCMTNLIIPLFMGLGLFLTLQGVAIGLNVLLEIDFNFRESRM